MKPDINISSDNELAFCNACRGGHLDIAKWLLEVKPTINILINNDYIFRSACNYGHVEVVKWLVNLKPDRYEITDANIDNKNRMPFIQYEIYDNNYRPKCKYVNKILKIDM